MALRRLAQEIVVAIVECVEDVHDLACLRLADRVLFLIGIQRPLRLQEIIAPWRGDRLICLGDYHRYVGVPESVTSYTPKTVATNKDDHSSFFSDVCKNFEENADLWND